jgi:hypothetical protein
MTTALLRSPRFMTSSQAPFDGERAQKGGPSSSPKSLHGRRVKRGEGWLAGVTGGEDSGG